MRNLHDYGFWILFKKMFSHAVKPFFENERFILYAIDLDNIREETVKKNGLSFKLVGPKDHKLIDGIEDMEEWLKGKVKKNSQPIQYAWRFWEESNCWGFTLPVSEKGISL